MQPSLGLLFNFGLSLCLSANAGILVRRDEVSLRNGKDVISLNAKFKTLNSLSPCEANEVACIDDSFAQCVDGHFVLTPCTAGLICRASPKMDTLGTTVDCMIGDQNTEHIFAARVEAAPVPPDDPSQTSLTLDPAVISDGFKNDGQDNITSPNQAPSGTSSNNWINFCKTVDKPLTNGRQIPGGSCNTAPIGVIPSTNNMPSAKFIFPPNFERLAKKSAFTISIAINHLETGWFTNPQETYMSSPQQLNSNGDVLGHSHVVIEQLTGFGQTTPTDPTMFTFFKGLNDPAVNGVLSCDVTGGLAVGYYRAAVIHSGANHQPIALPTPQRGAMGDMVYFSVVE